MDVHTTFFGKKRTLLEFQASMLVEPQFHDFLFGETSFSCVGKPREGRKPSDFMPAIIFSNPFRIFFDLASSEKR